MYSCGPPLMDVQGWDNQHELTYSNYVRTQDVTLKTCRRRWMIGRNGERGSGISALTARHDDDDDVCIYPNPLPQAGCVAQGHSFNILILVGFIIVFWLIHSLAFLTVINSEISPYYYSTSCSGILRIIIFFTHLNNLVVSSIVTMIW